MKEINSELLQLNFIANLENRKHNGTSYDDLASDVNKHCFRKSIVSVLSPITTIKKLVCYKLNIYLFLTKGLGYASPAYGYAGYPGYAGYAGHGSHGVVIAGPASHGAILAGPASHGAVLSGPHSGSAAVSGPHAGSVVIAGPSGKITTHGTGFGGIHTGHGHW